MRICDLTTLYLDGGQGGVNTYLLEKARFCAESGGVDEHVIVVPGKRDDRRALSGSTVYTLKSPRLPSNPEHRVMTRFGRVQQILRDVRPDVVEVDCAYLLGKVASSVLAARDVPVVGFYHVHLPTFIARPSASRFGRGLASAAEHWAWRYVDYCHRHCDRLVVSSNDMQRRLEARGLGGLDLVPLGVNLDLFRPATEPRGGRAPTVLSVGRLSREKDLGVLLEAFRILAARRPDARLLVIGDGPERGRLERLAGGDPRIELLGSRPYGDELARLYRSADVLAVTSPHDTFNLTILEGLAAGLPVVAADQGGPVDLITSEVGALARAGDPADFAGKLEGVLGDLSAFAGCRAHVERNYSWQRTFDRLLGVYDRAARRRPAHIASA